MRQLILYLLVMTLATSVQAQDKTIQYNAQIVKASKAPAKRILSAKDWSKFVQNSGTSILEEMGGIAQLESPFLIHPGVKNPIPYKDPRPGMYQVQYVDVGMKLDTRVNAIPGGLLKVSSRLERSISDPHPDLDARFQVMIIESETVMKRGQVAVFGSVTGLLALKHMKKQFPNLPFKETDTLLMVVTIK